MPIAVALLSAGKSVWSLNEANYVHKKPKEIPNLAIKVILGTKN